MARPTPMKIDMNAVVDRLEEHLELLGYELEDLDPAPEADEFSALAADHRSRSPLFVQTWDDAVVLVSTSEPLPKIKNEKSLAELYERLNDTNRAAKFTTWYFRPEDGEDWVHASISISGDIVGQFPRLLERFERETQKYMYRFLREEDAE